jgi:hypothetical protein
MGGFLVRAGAIFAFLALAATALAFVATLSPSLLPRTQVAEAAAPRLAADATVATPAAAPPPALTPQRDGSSPIALVDRSGAPLQCALYARQRSGVQLTGDARTWWAQAEGRYQRAATPSAGAVIVMDGTSAGHVGVVARVINQRQIVIDHANWLGDGEIITGALVEDASPANDWSQVRVWNVETNSMGIRPYPVLGFVLPDAL